MQIELPDYCSYAELFVSKAFVQTNLDEEVNQFSTERELERSLQKIINRFFLSKLCPPHHSSKHEHLFVVIWLSCPTYIMYSAVLRESVAKKQRRWAVAYDSDFNRHKRERLTDIRYQVVKSFMVCHLKVKAGSFRERLGDFDAHYHHLRVQLYSVSDTLGHKISTWLFRFLLE